MEERGSQKLPECISPLVSWYINCFSGPVLEAVSDGPTWSLSAFLFWSPNMEDSAYLEFEGLV